MRFVVLRWRWQSGKRTFPAEEGSRGEDHTPNAGYIRMNQHPEGADAPGDGQESLAVQLTSDHAVLLAKLERSRASQAISERAIVDLQEHLQKETTSNTELREKVASLSLELQRTRRGSTLSRVAETLRKEMGEQKKKYEDAYRELEGKQRRLLEQAESRRDLAEKSAAGALVDEQKKREDTVRILEWEKARNREIQDKQVRDYEKQIEELRRDSEDRLLAAVDRTKKATKLEMEKQLQALVSKHEENVASLEAQYKERLAEQASEYEGKLSSLAKQNRADIEAVKKVKDEGASTVSVEEGRETTSALRRKVTQLNETIKIMEVHMAKMVVDQQRQQTIAAPRKAEKAASGVPKRGAGGGGIRGHGKRQQLSVRAEKEKEQDHVLGSKQAIDFFRGQTKKAKLEIKKLVEERQHLEDSLRLVNQDNSIWAQDVERLKGAIAVLQRKNKRLKSENSVLKDRVSIMNKINEENMRLQSYISNETVPNRGESITGQPTPVTTDLARGHALEPQQATLSTPYAAQQGKRSIDQRPFGLGNASYAEISRSRKVKKRSLELDETHATMMATQDPDKDVPPADALDNDHRSAAIVSSHRNEVNGRDSALAIDDLEEDEIKVLTAKPRDISVLPSPRPSPSSIDVSTPQSMQKSLKQPSQGGSSSPARRRKSLSPRNRRHRRSPGSPRSPKRNIAFGVPAELDSSRDSHHRAHPKMGARQYFDQHAKRSKLATSDDVASAEKRRLQYRFPAHTNSAAQTPEKFQGALAVMAERSAVEDLIEERKKRQDTLQVLEWERVRHNEALSEEKEKYDKYLDKERKAWEKEKNAALAQLTEKNMQQLVDAKKKYDKRLAKELDKTEDNADEKLARAKEKFNRSRAEFERKAAKEKKILLDQLKREQNAKKDSDLQQQKLLNLVNELEDEVKEVKKKSELSERRASLASEALEYERESSILANESIDEQEELISMVHQLEKERDDARRREVIAREALKREKRKNSPAGKHWKPNSYNSPSKAGGYGIQLDGSPSQSKDKAKRSPFLRRGGSAVKREQARIRSLASGKILSKVDVGKASPARGRQK